ncbi:MAG: hypothetical protein GX601_09485, partial [Anaerolineales bacterium]|nr:hypothetical protein [Anaerolineales bacterium]
LPVVIDGQPAGEMLGLGLIRVGGETASEAPPRTPDGAQPVFGDAIRLEGLRFEREGDLLQIEAWWRAIAPLQMDLTAFVHLYDADGGLLDTGDAPPLGGAYPTSMWQVGDVLADTYVLSWQEGAQRVGLGWYDPASATRLPAEDPAGRLADDAYRFAAR